MGQTPKMTGSQYSATWNPNTYKSPLKVTDYQKNISSGWAPYQPTKATTGWAIGDAKKTPYEPLQGDVMSGLSSMIKSGGYTPESKQTMVQGAMAPVYEAAERMKKEAQADAYSRGLGQSGVLSRSYGDIDKSTLSQLAQVTGGIEQSSQENAMQNITNAINLYQQGKASEQDVGLAVEQMKLQNAATNAQFEQEYNNLKSQINIDDRQMQLMLAELDQAAYMGDQDRALKESEIMNNFGISQAQLAQAQWIAEHNAKAQQDQMTLGILDWLI